MHGARVLQTTGAPLFSVAGFVVLISIMISILILLLLLRQLIFDTARIELATAAASPPCTSTRAQHNLLPWLLSLRDNPGATNFHPPATIARKKRKEKKKVIPNPRLNVLFKSRLNAPSQTPKQDHRVHHPAGHPRNQSTNSALSTLPSSLPQVQ